MFVWRFWSRAGKVSGRSGASQPVAGGELTHAVAHPGTASPTTKALCNGAVGRNTAQDSPAASFSYVYVDNFR